MASLDPNTTRILDTALSDSRTSKVAAVLSCAIILAYRDLAEVLDVLWPGEVPVDELPILLRSPLFEVQDNGCYCISPHLRGEVFRRFHRSDPQRAKQLHRVLAHHQQVVVAGLALQIWYARALLAIYLLDAGDTIMARFELNYLLREVGDEGARHWLQQLLKERKTT